MREPQVAIGAGRDADGYAPAVMALNSVTNYADGVITDAVAVASREPQIAIGPAA